MLQKEPPISERLKRSLFAVGRNEKKLQNDHTVTWAKALISADRQASPAWESLMWV
jgi:hypothetical protein